MSKAQDNTEFLESLMDTNLYSMGAFFCDKHPDLIDEVIGESEAIEETGIEPYSVENEIDIEVVFQTLITGLAIRYFKAVTGI